MDLTIVTQLAKESKRHGLTLQWTQIHLIERSSRNEQRLGALGSRDSRSGDTDAQALQLENEALALVLKAMRKVYPAGTDIEIPSRHEKAKEAQWQSRCGLATSGALPWTTIG